MIFAILIALIYAYLPRAASGGANPLIVVLIIVLAYISLAWYDYAYSCSDKMFSGAIFKPQLRQDPSDIVNTNAIGQSKEARLVADQEKAYLHKVYLFHATVVAPLLLYIGYMGAQSNPSVWGFAGGLGALALVYHGGRLKYPRQVWP